jgi:hypothetical protein
VRVFIADAHAHFQGLSSVFKMTTVLEECAAEEQRFLRGCLWTKEPSSKDIHEEMFHV